MGLLSTAYVDAASCAVPNAQSQVGDASLSRITLQGEQLIHWSGAGGLTSGVWDKANNQWLPGPTMDRGRADPLIAYIGETSLWFLGKNM